MKHALAHRLLLLCPSMQDSEAKTLLLQRATPDPSSRWPVRTEDLNEQCSVLARLV